MADSNVALNDALADTAIETLALYKEHMRNGRYTDAQLCLVAVDELTQQTVRLEENDETFNANEAALSGWVAPEVARHNP